MGDPYEKALPWLAGARLNRWLGTALISVSIVAVGEAVALVTLMPLKTTELKIIEFRSGTNNFVSVADAEGTLQGNRLLLEKEVRRYVASREPIDKVTEPERYRVVRAMSSTSVWNDFRSAYRDLVTREGFKRTIEIRRAAQVADRIWQVEFDTNDSNGNSGQWVATLRFEYRPQRVVYDDRLLNPTGLTVTEYSLSRRQGQ